MQANVLVVEDVEEMSDLIKLYLEKEGLAVRCAESGEAALAALSGWKADLVVLDLNLPGMDGFEFLHRFRKTEACPVLIVSARDSEGDIISGLGYGADEFVTKPFSPRVLAARVRAMLRRRLDAGQSEKDDAAKTRFGPFTLDRAACLLRRGDERISLSAKEFGVLDFLVAHRGTPQSPDAIYASVWKNAFGDLTAVAVYIQRLRKKIEEDSSAPRYIETVHGMGYRLCAEPEERSR